MNVRTIARAIALITLLGAGITMIRELQTWEWHRAVVAGIFALIAEVALATSMILDRIGKAPAAAPRVRTASSSSSRRRQSPVTTSRGCVTRRGPTSSSRS